MNDRTREQLAEVISAAVIVSLTLGVNWFISKTLSVRGDVREGLWIAFVFSQLALAAVWLVRGSAWLIARLLPPLVIMETVSWFYDRHRMPMIVMVVFFGFVTLGTIGLAVIGHLQNRALTPQAGKGSQFSISQLLGVTTSVAVMFAFANLHRDDMGIDQIRPSRLELIFICGCFALMALVGVGSGLGTERRWLGRIALPPLSAMGLSFCLVTAMGRGGRPDVWELFVAFLAQAGFVAAGLLVYRLIGPSIFRPAEATSEESAL